MLAQLRRFNPTRDEFYACKSLLATQVAADLVPAFSRAFLSEW